MQLACRLGLDVVSDFDVDICVNWQEWVDAAVLTEEAMGGGVRLPKSGLLAVKRSGRLLGEGGSEGGMGQFDHADGPGGVPSEQVRK